MYLRPTTENLSMKAQKEEEALLNVDSTSESTEEVHVDDMDIQTYIRYGSEVCTLLGVLSYVIFQQGDEIKNQGLAAFTKQLVCINFLSNIPQPILIDNFSLKGSCSSQGNFSDFKYSDFGMHSVPNYR